jgi:hypothetical protein
MEQCYHLVARRGTEIGVAIAPGGWLLPCRFAPDNVRAADVVARLLRASSGVGWLTRLVPVAFDAENNVLHNAAVVCLERHSGRLVFRTPESLTQKSALLSVQHRCLTASLATPTGLPDTWPETTTRWVSDVVLGTGHHLLGGYRQYRVSDCRAVVAFDTDSGQVYATIGQGSRGTALPDYIVVSALKAVSLEIVPQVLCRNCERMLIAGARGDTMSGEPDLGEALRAETTIVSAQRALSNGAASALRQLPVLSIDILSARVQRLLSAFAERSDAPAEWSDLSEYADRLFARVEQLDVDVRPAEVWVNTDWAPANTFVTADTIELIDFEESYLASPLFGLAVLVGRYQPRSCGKELWRSIVAGKHLAHDRFLRDLLPVYESLVDIHRGALRLEGLLGCHGIERFSPKMLRPGLRQFERRLATCAATV